MKTIKFYILSLIIGLTFCNTIFANTCPSVSQLWQGNFNGWRVYVYANDNPQNYRPASGKEIKAITQDTHLFFASSVWNNAGVNPSNANCVYGGSAPDNKGFILFKNESQPSGSNWRLLGTTPYTTLICAANDTSNCPFPNA
jgi:hypothetical protein